MRNYSQLTLEQRYVIYTLHLQDYNQTKIAELIGVHKSTVSRELRRNVGLKSYRYQQAHNKAEDRRKRKLNLRIDGNTWSFIEDLINNDWSPEQIHGWMQAHMGYTVSHEWIYQYIIKDKQAGGSLHTHLRCKKKRKKRYGSIDGRGSIKNRVGIDERPTIVDSRSRIGDWELDTIIGKGHKQALVSITERKSRLSLFSKVEQKTALQVKEAITRLLSPVRDQVYTLTSDNGEEFSDHENIACNLNADFYFAHPYASYERGSNENMNGLIRQYFPKGREFKTITNDEIIRAINRLNNRPRKCLGFKTPYQVFFEEVSIVALNT